MITLCMIVRNESTVLRRCLESVRHLLSSWLVVDTGSTDGTQDLVRELLADIPGRLVERPWVSFGHNRTEALRLAGEAGNTVLELDADQTVSGHLEPLSTDAGLVLVEEPGQSYRLPRLTRPGIPWRYVGATHEYLDYLPYTYAPVDSLRIRHHHDGGCRADKFKRDLVLLKGDLARKPGDPRTLFYLANTYRDLGKPEQALKHYQARARVKGWEEEGWLAAVEAGKLLLPQDPGRGLFALLEAWQRRPHRAEPLYALATYYRNKEQWDLCRLYAERAMAISWPAQDTLFVDRAAHTWGPLLEDSVAASRLGHRARARADNVRLMGMDLPPHVRACVMGNLRFCVEDGNAVPGRLLHQPPASIAALLQGAPGRAARAQA